jgi:Secretion system C-terminal sorting domain
MKRIVLFFLAFCLYGISDAQNITAVEYFVDADPGAGSGTAVSITAATSITKAFDVPITAIADGFHTLSIRTKDINNKWSTTFTSPFYKLPPSVTTAPNINKLEYFIDTDPGAGSGTNVPVTAGTSVAGLIVNVPITSVADGFHTITFRTRDVNNKWSTSFTSPFYKLPPTVSTVPNINKMEYFIDADLGAGAGTDVPVTAGSSVAGLIVNVPITSVADGFHTITFRTRDANNKWSTAFASPFYKLSEAALSAAPNLTKLEYFIDNDPGVDAGIPLTITAATSLTNYIFDVDVSALSTGEHKLSVRGLDAAGNWSIVHISTIGIFGPAPTAQPTSVTFTSITATTYTVTYTAPATAPAGYIAIRKVGSAPTTDPIDGKTYAKNDNLGDGKVAYVGTAATFPETGLLADTKYFYKIYAYNGATTLTNYLTLAPLQGNTSTLPDPVTIVSEIFPTTYNKGGTLTVSVTVNSAAKASGVKIKYKGISDADADLKTATVTATGNTFAKTFAVSELTDAIGLKYYFEVTGTNTVVITGTTRKSYVQYPSGESIPALSFGDKLSNYQLIAVPLNLTNKSVTSVFDALGSYDKTQWRLFDFAAGDNREYPGFNTIDAGKGYWLIMRNNTTINPGAGSTLSVDETNPFVITLAPGWNLIGNPYNFKISWADVLAASGNPAGVSTSLTVFGNGTLGVGTELAPYRGGFVNNTTATAIEIKIPTLRNKALNGGRISSNEEIDLTTNEWNIPISVSNGELTNARGGVGMHPMATQSGRDNFDLASVPLVEGLNIPELDFSAKGSPIVFNKDVVPSQQNFSWQFEILGSGDEPLQIKWPVIEKKGTNELVLFDVASQRVIDMTNKQEINISSQSKTLKIFFGDRQYIANALEKELPVIGQPYPNPANEIVHIPFYISDALDNSNVNIKIYNTVGQEVALLADSDFGKGTHVVSWKPSQPTGLYIIAMKVGSGTENRVRLVIK